MSRALSRRRLLPDRSDAVDAIASASACASRSARCLHGRASRVDDDADDASRDEHHTRDRAAAEWQLEVGATDAFTLLVGEDVRGDRAATADDQDGVSDIRPLLRRRAVAETS